MALCVPESEAPAEPSAVSRGRTAAVGAEAAVNASTATATAPTTAAADSEPFAIRDWMNVCEQQLPVVKVALQYLAQLLCHPRRAVAAQKAAKYREQLVSALHIYQLH